jgi:hypothetical protein
MWNHKPVVVYHPEVNGMAVSACDPDTLTQRKIGVIMNSHFKDGKLRAEAWLDPERMDSVDTRVKESIEKNEMMELSTGVFTDNEHAEGEWNDEPYVAVARNYRPDHLALLPDVIGACSVEDGAGFLRCNEEMSHGTVRSLLSAALDDDVYIEDVFDNFVIFVRDGAFFKQSYVEKDDAVMLVDTPEEVVRVTEYRTKNGDVIGNLGKESTMNKEQKVKALIENARTKWTNEDKDTLMALEEEVIDKMTPEETSDDGSTAEGEGDDADAKVEGDDADAKVEGDDAEVENAAREGAAALNPEPKKPMSVEEYVNNAPAEIRAMLVSGVTSYRRDKKKVIDAITANEHNAFSQKQLQGKDLVELQQIAALCQTNKAQDDGQSFLGQEGAVDLTANVEEPLEIPSTA